MSKHYDWLIAGAGFTGAVVAERLASQLDKKVLVVDRRPHIGGNAFDFRNEAGDLVHLYGPHIFHTNSSRVFNHLSQFTEWNVYFHHVLGHIDGRMVPIPFNINSIYELFPFEMASRLSEDLIHRFGFGAKVPIMKMKEDGAGDNLRFLSDYIFEKVFLQYTTKQWGRGPEELDPSVTARVPVMISRDNRYFQDRYQAMPKEGYTPMFERMLQHPNIDVELGVGFDQVEPLRYDAAVYCGALDEFFGYIDGALPYRSLRFDFDTVGRANHLPVGTVNYPNEFDFTRMTDFSRLTGETRATTTIVTEYPEEYTPGVNEPYYPVPSPETKTLVRPYAARAAEMKGKVWFAGRLADYQYYNMDQACARGLSLFEKELVPHIRDRG